jgi:hypothetical protein
VEPSDGTEETGKNCPKGYNFGTGNNLTTPASLLTMTVTGKGRTWPSTLDKYSSEETTHNAWLGDLQIPVAAVGYIRASITTGTWKKHSSALNYLHLYEASLAELLEWPVSVSAVCGFASWALSSKDLKPSTVKSYLSSSATVHELRGYATNECFNPIVKRVVKGAENLGFYKCIASESRKVMTLPLLKLLGHEIAKTSWSEDSKQVFWTACVTAFFGSFQFGELLSSSEWGFNKDETLLWSDVTFSDNSVLIHVKISKSRATHGEYIDLFPFTGHNCCPVKCLQRLKNLSSKRSPRIPLDKEPVFAFSSGKLLTSRSLNETLENLLKPHLGSQATLIQGHSFRAAIPSAMANNPDMASVEDLKSWGRWNSDSFKLYTRLKLKKKRLIFNKITSILNS